jgi:ribonuclease D
VTPTDAPTAPEHPVGAELVTCDDDLDALVDTLLAQPRYAMDTEFHRERTYHPRLALVQVAWDGGSALVDPLAVDVTRLARLLEGPPLAVLHAAQQDLDVLSRTVGAVPARLFDTQLAAGFLGYATPSLASLLAGELRVRLPKGDRLTDWLHRPLTAEQTEYALADVDHLLALHDRLVAQLTELGRLGWAEEECELLRTRPTGPAEPEQAWRRLKDLRSLNPRARGVAAAVAAWRERRAAAIDQPLRSVLPDLAVLGIAQRAPRTMEELRRCRGVDERHTRGQPAADLLAAVAVGVAGPPPPEPDGAEEALDRALRPAATLVSAWISQLARDERIDTSLLGTRSDILDLLSGAADARLAHGWRAELVGDGVRRLVHGEAAIAFDGRGNLLLVDRP